MSKPKSNRIWQENPICVPAGTYGVQHLIVRDGKQFAKLTRNYTSTGTATLDPATDTWAPVWCGVSADAPMTPLEVATFLSTDPAVSHGVQADFHKALTRCIDNFAKRHGFDINDDKRENQ